MRQRTLISRSTCFSLIPQIAPGHTERSTQLPYQPCSCLQKGFWFMEQNEKKNPWARENGIRWIFLWKFKILHFLPHFMWEQGSGKMRRAHVRAMLYSVRHSSQALPVSSSLWTEYPKPGSTLKVLIWETQKNHRNNHRETTKLKTTPNQLRGRAGQWLWSREETLILFPE